VLTGNLVSLVFADPASEERFEKGDELGRLRGKPFSPVADFVKCRIPSGSGLLTRTSRLHEAVTQKQGMTGTNNTASTNPSCVSKSFTFDFVCRRHPFSPNTSM